MSVFLIWCNPEGEDDELQRLWRGTHRFIFSKNLVSGA
jgi:hypothetical protein